MAQCTAHSDGQHRFGVSVIEEMTPRDKHVRTKAKRQSCACGAR